MKEFTLAGFAEFIAHELTDNTHEARVKALELGAKMVQREAKRAIGTYDYGWPELAQSTQGERESLGYEPDEPLLRDGTLRDSIEYTIVEPGHEAQIGSNSDIAVWQELGTATIPARSFLDFAALAKEKAIARAAGKLFAAAMAGQSIAGEIAKLMVEAAKEVGHTARELVEPDESERSPEELLTISASLKTARSRFAIPPRIDRLRFSNR